MKGEEVSKVFAEKNFSINKTSGNLMNSKLRIFFAVPSLILAVWIIDSAVQSFYYTNYSFFDLLFANVAANILISRILVIIYFLIFTLAALLYIKMKKRLQNAASSINSDGKNYKRNLNKSKVNNNNINGQPETLNILYEVARSMLKSNYSIEEILQKTVKVLPSSWQYPEITVVRISYNGSSVKSEKWKNTKWVLSSDLVCAERTLGRIDVAYTEEKPDADEGPFLIEERRLVDAIGILLGDFIYRKKIEANLKKSEKQFRDLYENSTLGIFRSSPQGKIIMANPAVVSLFGCKSLEELFNVNITERYVLPDDRKRFMQIIENEGTVHGFETKLKKTDGAIFYARESSRAVKDDGGTVLYYEGIIEDISEKKKVEEELIKAKEKAEEINRLKSNLLSNMSHELRTPLSGILGFSEMLTDEIKDPYHKELIVTIHQNGQRLLRTLNSLLNLSKLESEQVELKIEETDVYKKVLSIAAPYIKTAAGKGIAFKTDSKIDNLKINVDSVLFEQIISNIIDNSIKFTEAGEISIVVDGKRSENTNWAVITIKDTGIGISAESLKYIFEPFRQASEGLSRNFEGTGIGLTLAKKYVELMNGEILVESEVGRGTVFNIKFPLSRGGIQLKPEVKKEKETKAEQTAGTNTGDNNLPMVLLVEDDSASVDITKYFLQGICNIDSVDNGKDALLLVIEKKYDAILMDIDLTGDMDGLDTTKEIRKLPSYKNTPIIALTAFAMSGDEEMCLEAGCSHYIAKPAKRDVLRKMVTGALQSARQKVSVN